MVACDDASGFDDDYLKEQLPKDLKACNIANMTQESSSGPDRILPADDYVSTAKDGCVKLRITKEWPANRPPVSVPTAVKKQCESAGDITALAVKRNGKWVKWSYKMYYEAIVKTAKAFIALGLEPHNSVCIFGKLLIKKRYPISLSYLFQRTFFPVGFNAPEWHFSDIGAIFAGGKVLNIGNYFVYLCNQFNIFL